MSWQAALVGAVVAGVAGAVLPRLIAWLPEPEPQQQEEAGESATRQQAKELYRDIAGLRWVTPTLVALSAGGGALLGARLGLGFPGMLWIVLLPFLVALSVIDVRTHLLPTRMVLPLTGAALLAGTVAAGASGEWADWRRAVGALILGRSLFWVLWKVRRAGMGFGDVRLAALLGFALGWLGTAQAVIGLYAAFVCFALVVFAWLLISREGGLLKRHLPFGPFLVIGALSGALAGEQLSRWLGYGG